MLAEITMIPLDKGSSFSKYVAQSIAVIEKSGLPYVLGPMGTTVEGPLDKVYDLIKRMHRNLRRQSGRVSVQVKIDDRKGRRGELERKTASVEAKAKRKLHRLRPAKRK